jgi:hypothetical protein
MGVFYPLELLGNGVQCLIPGNGFKLPAAPLSNPFEGALEAVRCFDDLFLGKPPGAGLRAGSRVGIRADANDFFP